MIVLSIHDTANNGMAVNTSVTLDIDAIGVPIETEDGEPRPFHVKTYVSGSFMASSFHKTSSDAKGHAEKMHAAYLEVHS